MKIATHKKLTQIERERLAVWLKEGVAKKEIARLLGRDIKTIRRELTRNRTRVAVGDNDWQVIYEPVHAQHVADQRKQNAFNAKEPLKNKKIFAYVLEKLRDSWSPEQIAGRLKKQDHPADPMWNDVRTYLTSEIDPQEKSALLHAISYFKKKEEK